MEVPIFHWIYLDLLGKGPGISCTLGTRTPGPSQTWHGSLWARSGLVRQEVLHGFSLANPFSDSPSRSMGTHIFGELEYRIKARAPEIQAGLQALQQSPHLFSSAKINEYGKKPPTSTSP